MALEVPWSQDSATVAGIGRGNRRGEKVLLITQGKRGSAGTGGGLLSDLGTLKKSLVAALLCCGLPVLAGCIY